MNKILSIFKNKEKQSKIVFSILFLSTIFLSFPFSTYAVAKEGGLGTWADKQTLIGTLNNIADSASTNLAISQSLSFFQSFVVVIGQWVVNGALKIAALSMIILSYIIANLKNPITTDPSFIPAWASMRDLANMIIVLGFVVIGLATTLRIRDYEAKKLLLPLIIMAILINFSNVFCGLVIDASNIMMLSEGSNMPYKIYLELAFSSQRYLTPELTLNSSEFLGSCVLFAFMFLGVAFTFFYLALILIARYAILIMLFILSPLAFVFWVFPPTKKLWTEWWNNFIKWCFVGVFSSLVLSLATTIMSTQSGFQGKRSAEFSSLFISSIIVLMFLYVGFKMTAKKTGLASMAAGAVMGLATGGAGLAMGAVSGAAGVTGLKGLAQRGGEKVKDMATSAGEKMKLVADGTTKLNQQKRLEESSKRLGAKYEDNAEGNAGLAKVATGKAFTAQQKKDKAAAGEILAKRNAMGAIEESKREGVARYSTASGADKNTFTKVDPSLSFKTDKQKDKEATEQLKNEERIRLETMGYTPDKVEARVRAFKPNEASLSAKKAEMAKAKVQENKLGFKDVTNEDAENRIRGEYIPPKTDIDNLIQNGYNAPTGQHMSFRNEAEAKKFLQAQMPKPTATQIASTRETMTNEKIREKAIGFTHATENDGRQYLIDQKTKELKGLGVTGKAADSQLEKYMAGIVDTDIRTAMGDVNQERISKAIKKVSVSKMGELSEKAIDAQTLGAMNIAQIRDGIGKNGSAELTDKVKKYVDISTAEGQEFDKLISSAKTPAERTNLLKIFATIQNDL